MSLREEIKHGLRFGPLRAWWKSLWLTRRVHLRAPKGETMHLHYSHPERWDSDTHFDEVRWLRNMGFSDADIRANIGIDPLKPPTPKICASCKKRGWHWTQHPSADGNTILRRKETCLGNGEYFEPPPAPPRDARNPFR